MRSGRIAEEFTHSRLQQQPTGQEALISRLQLKASKGDTGALATLRMLDSMHGQNRGGSSMRMSGSPSVDQNVRSDARSITRQGRCWFQHAERNASDSGPSGQSG